MRPAVYIDLCALKRPFDDQTQPRVWLESDAMSVVMQAVQSGQIELVGSTVLDLENSRNPWQSRRELVAQWLGFAARKQVVTIDIERRAVELENAGLKGIDAAHLACAEAAMADAFVTCDDRIAPRYMGPLKIYTPIEYLQILGITDDDQSA
jgi:hypothetical protein